MIVVLNGTSSARKTSFTSPWPSPMISARAFFLYSARPTSMSSPLARASSSLSPTIPISGTVYTARGSAALMDRTIHTVNREPSR